MTLVPGEGDFRYCPHCRYDLSGNPGVRSCPECGYEMPEGWVQFRMARNRYASTLKAGPVTTRRLLELLIGALFATLMMFVLSGFRPFSGGFWYASPVDRLIAYLTLLSMLAALVALMLWCATCLVTLGIGRRENQAELRPEQPRLAFRSSWLYRQACKAAIALLILYFVFSGV